MIKQTWRFSALDTWFFREARQMESFGGSELDTVFPPPARTVMGAIRTAMGEALGVDWQEYKNNENYKINEIPFREYIGYDDNTGKLSIDGPWLSIQRNGMYERLYPIPSNLFRVKEEQKIIRLQVDSPIYCDLGKAVRLLKLPDLSDQDRKPKSLTGWISEKGLESFLAGKDDNISDKELFTDNKVKEQLFQRESRLGIARDNTTGTAQEGMLYQIRHIRPYSNIALEVDITADYNSVLEPVNLIRLGGENRLAGIRISKKKNIEIKAPQATKDSYGIILTLLTPALFGNREWLLPGFKLIEQDKETVWKGNLLGIDLTIHAAVLGKAQREGGWNLMKRKSRPVQSLVPAGSLYYCKVAGDIDNAINALHLKKIGSDNKLGRGLLAVGLWKNNEIIID
ncbi:hypothetical protein J7L67_07385 [bacterium]|nr:hypothetical protein [bacterium]